MDYNDEYKCICKQITRLFCERKDSEAMDKRFLALAMALMLVLAIMVSPVPGIADAGSFSGGSDWSSSGSDWSSSDWSSSDYSSSSGGGGEWSLGTTITVVAIVIIMVIVSGRNKKGGSGSGSGSGGSRIAGAQRTVLPMTIEDLKKQDPAFSEEKMKEKIGNLYVMMQECWQNKTWEEMRTGMDDAIFNQFNAQLNSLIKAGKTNYVDDIAVLGVDLTGFGQDDKHDIVTALVRVRIKDYTVDDATGAVVSGSKTAEKFMTYEWTMIRTKGAKSFERTEDAAKNCPNCGAPLDLNATAKCQYCGAVIQSADFDWVIKTIKGISQQTSGR